MFVCDYAWARPSPAAIKAAGFVAVCRYLSHDTTGKTLTGPELSALHAAGLGVVLNFEDAAGRAQGGFSAGQADAQFANQLAASLGAPSDVAIYYSVDTDPGSPLSATITAYIHGLVAVPQRPVGIYGGAGLVQWALNAGVRYGWTANASSWNHGIAPAGHLHQLYSHPANTPLIAGTAPDQYDTSEILVPAFGAWGGASQGDTLMALTDAQQQDLYIAATTLSHNLLQGLGHSLVNDVLGAIAALPHPPTADQIAASVVAKLPAGAAVDVNALAKAIVKAEGTALSAAP